MNTASRRMEMIKMRVKGFTGAHARWWVNAVEYDRNHNINYSSKEKEWAYKNGFLPEFVERYGINRMNKNKFVSIYDYMHIYPINDVFRKWLKDRVTTRKVLKPFKDNLLEQYYHLYMRDGAPMIIRLEDCPGDFLDSFEGILQLIRTKERVFLAKTVGLVHDIISYVDGKYYFNEEEKNENELIAHMKNIIKKGIRVITEIPECSQELESGDMMRPNILRLIVYNKYADNPKIGQATLRFQTDSTMTSPIMDEMGERVGNNIEEFKGNTAGESEIEADDGVYNTNFIEDQIVLPKKGKQKNIARYLYVPVNVNDGSYNGGKQLDDKNVICNISYDSVRKQNLVGKVAFWDEINNVICSIGKFIPQIEVMGVDIIITETGFKIVDVTDHPYYPQVVGFNEEMRDYFKLKVSQQNKLANSLEYLKTNFKSKTKTFIWIRLTKLFGTKEMRPLIFRWWYLTVKDDLFSKNGLSLKQKIWAYKKGFLSYRLTQYGITKDNYKNFISDYDYRFLRHINNKYRVWLEDKITVKYICSKFSEFFPKYYYHISVRNGEKRVIGLMDLPEYCGTDFESIFRLVENVGELACKPQRGSQGQGFYKFSYSDGKYYLNHKEVTKVQVLKVLNDVDSQYLITEYIKQHPVINNIYPGAVNTLRIITFMKDGKTPEIGNAYMRFGSKKTGAVDNMGAGGMFVQVDMETGKFYNGKIITENSIQPCSKHPDTGIEIEGLLPNWELVKEGVKELNLEMPQLEYLGFDVAITEDGMKLPEINRAPGYPKIEVFNRATIDYLLYKRKVKMKQVGIEKTKW